MAPTSRPISHESEGSPGLTGGFYVGVFNLNHAVRFPRSFISVNRLHNRVRSFPVNDWILDSGAFTELNRYGRYRFSPEVYFRQVRRWARLGTLRAAVSQDYMCEPFVLRRTGLTVADHQRLTIARYETLLSLGPTVTIMPVLQGYEEGEYLRHLRDYGRLLAPGAWVGVGSVCKRNSRPGQVARILQVIHRARPDLRLHGFGLKTTALTLPLVVRHLYSCDSMAWSFAARYEGRDANDVEEAAYFWETVHAIIVKSGGSPPLDFRRVRASRPPEEFRCKRSRSRHAPQALKSFGCERAEPPSPRRPFAG